MSATRSHRPVILVVEMDERVRTLLYRAFQQAGFRVLLASNPEAAVKLYKGTQSAVAVVLLSAHRTRLNGCRVLAALQEKNPSVRCVIATEITPEDEILPLARQGAAGLLAKPLHIHEAVSVVSRVMEGDWIAPPRKTSRRRSGKSRARSAPPAMPPATAVGTR
jgi:DNA-binding NtrC family response regulator